MCSSIKTIKMTGRKSLVSKRRVNVHMGYSVRATGAADGTLHGCLEKLGSSLQLVHTPECSQLSEVVHLLNCSMQHSVTEPGAWCTLNFRQALTSSSAPLYTALCDVSSRKELVSGR